ncbi:MAG: hypothetical protein IPP01_07465 [Saprospiraceae bacterium]|nr:hypothetical protein [Saprospiraceae bacterium]
MSSIELKTKVYRELESAEDYLLEEISVAVESKSDEVIKIPEHFKEALDKSIAQMESGIRFQMLKLKKYKVYK